MDTEAIQIDKTQSKLLDKYKEFGFRNRNELMNFAFSLLRTKIERKIELQQSAEIYAELYKKDEEIQFLTESAIIDWE
jgi:hypothetical protein